MESATEMCSPRGSASGDAPAAINGLGTVHHVAFAVDDPEQQLELRRELIRRCRAAIEAGLPMVTHS